MDCFCPVRALTDGRSDRNSPARVKAMPHTAVMVTGSFNTSAELTVVMTGTM